MTDVTANMSKRDQIAHPQETNDDVYLCQERHSQIRKTILVNKPPSRRKLEPLIFVLLSHFTVRVFMLGLRSSSKKDTPRTPS